MDKQEKLDHGLLNLALSKGFGSIIPISSEEILAKRNANLAVHAALKAHAKVLIQEMLNVPGLLDSKAALIGMKRSGLLDILDGWMKWEPLKIIQTHKKWMPQCVK